MPFKLFSYLQAERCTRTLSLFVLAITGSFINAQALDRFDLHRGRPIGVVEAVESDGTGLRCAGAIVSQSHVLVPNCPGLAGKARFRFLLGNEAAVSAFPMEGPPVEAYPGWMIYSVKDRPSQYFGIVPFGMDQKIFDNEAPEKEPVEPGNKIEVIRFVPNVSGKGFRKIARKDCTVKGYLPGNPKRFEYTCSDSDQSKSEYPEFVFDAGDNGLAGFERTAGTGTALEIVDLRKRSKLLSKLKSPLPSTWADGNLTHALLVPDKHCELAGRYASNPEELMALSSTSYDRIAILLRGCAEQMHNNKWKEPENRNVTVIRVRRQPDWVYEYEFHTVSRDETYKIINSCWFSTGYVEVLSRAMKIPPALELPFCAEFGEALQSNNPLMMNPVDATDEDNYRTHPGNRLGEADAVITAFADTRPVVTINPSVLKPDPRVKVGQIDARCLLSWDDSFQPHSLGFEGLKPVWKWKKLRHCMKLTSTGPVDAKQIAKEYVDFCVNKALNDDKVRHIVTVIAGLIADIASAGATGGSATAAAITDYVVEVQERAISCLTDEKNVENFVSQTLKGAFGADLKAESHWIYWKV